MISLKNLCSMANGNISVFEGLKSTKKKGVGFANWSFCAMAIEEDVFRAKRIKERRADTVNL